MAKVNRKLYIRKNGVTQSIDLYNDLFDVHSAYLPVRVDGQVYYARIEGLDGTNLSDLRIRKNGNIYGVCRTADHLNNTVRTDIYTWNWADRSTWYNLTDDVWFYVPCNRNINFYHYHEMSLWDAPGHMWTRILLDDTTEILPFKLDTDASYNYGNVIEGRHLVYFPPANRNQWVTTFAQNQVVSLGAGWHKARLQGIKPSQWCEPWVVRRELRIIGQ